MRLAKRAFTRVIATATQSVDDTTPAGGATVGDVADSGRVVALASLALAGGFVVRLVTNPDVAIADVAGCIRVSISMLAMLR